MVTRHGSDHKEVITITITITILSTFMGSDYVYNHDYRVLIINGYNNHGYSLCVSASTKCHKCLYAL